MTKKSPKNKKTSKKVNLYVFVAVAKITIIYNWLDSPNWLIFFVLDTF